MCQTINKILNQPGLQAFFAPNIETNQVKTIVPLYILNLQNIEIINIVISPVVFERKHETYDLFSQLKVSPYNVVPDLIKFLL